jgi:hypothetical protein
MAEAIRRPSAAAPAISRRSIRGPFPTVPAHVGTMLGLSVAGYSVALALVTGLQASSEGAINADRAALTRAIDSIATAHDRTEISLRGEADAYAAAAAGYQSVVDGLVAIDDRLAALASSVKAVDGASKALPASVALPPVIRSVRVVPRAVTHATSGGSGAP